LTPDGNDAAAAKRKDTARQWAGGYWYGRKKEDDPEPKEYVFDNVPVEGFRIADTVSRWTTDNKWFRIHDPRGFMVEISAYNLTDIIDTGVIDHGKLLGSFVWARDGSQNYLVRGDHPEYLESIKPKEDYTPVPGDEIEGTNVSGIYMGKFYMARVGTKVRYTESTSWLGSRTYHYDLVLGWDDKPWHIFMQGDYMDTSRSFPKTYVVKEKQKEPNPNIIAKNGSNGKFLFQTKAEIESFDLTETEAKDIFKTFCSKVDAVDEMLYLGKVKDPRLV
jgi:hypothetical protein